MAHVGHPYVIHELDMVNYGINKPENSPCNKLALTPTVHFRTIPAPVLVSPSIFRESSS